MRHMLLIRSISFIVGAGLVNSGEISFILTIVGQNNSTTVNDYIEVLTDLGLGGHPIETTCAH